MSPAKLTYAKLFNLGNYENERIEITIDLAPGVAVADAFNELRDLVEQQHKTFCDRRTAEYEAAIERDRAERERMRKEREAGSERHAAIGGVDLGF